MHPSLQGIANKADQQHDYRFLNLYTMLNKEFLLDSWRYLKKNVASGVDGLSAGEYEKELESNIENLVERLKKKSYRAKLVKRHYIPKGKDNQRPLGIPVVEDKLLQLSVSRILHVLYEPLFLRYSFGYRPRLSQLDAVKELTYELQYGWYGYVVEADIRGFFDNLNHDWLLEMLNLRINDRSFVGLIRKWLKAGILDTDGQVLHPESGTPQGGVVSPILANIYLHYALDLWFEKHVKPNCKGEVYLCRYADDFVCSFQYKREATRFLQELPNRLSKFSLSLSPEKTFMLSFCKHRMQEKNRFCFLGFEFYWDINRLGKPQIKRRTSRKKFRKVLSDFSEWIKKNKSMNFHRLFMIINSKLRGHYNYYGVIGNYDSLKEYYYHIERILKKWLNRRSQRKSYNWHGFRELLKTFKIAKPRITEKRNNQLKNLSSFALCGSEYH